jgi:NAD(P)-dependent dehydrogenase (short-subunit alcohol dehydrogenase family)
VEAAMSGKDEIAVVVGAGPGLGAALIRRFTAEGMRVAAAARDPAKLGPLMQETGVAVYACDAAVAADVERLFSAIDRDLGAPDIVVYNASGRLRGAVVDLDPVEVARTLQVSGFGGFLVAQAAARRMLPRGSGSILLTGASASVKGYARSASFAMGKFALRGLAQSLARELAPQGIHVAHFVIDGAIRTPGRNGRQEDDMLDPAAIADMYLQIHRQKRSAWTWEVELRPWVESF